jgi:hypothetical protein
MEKANAVTELEKREAVRALEDELDEIQAKRCESDPEEAGLMMDDCEEQVMAIVRMPLSVLLTSLTVVQATNFDTRANIHVFGGILYGGTSRQVAMKACWFTGSRALATLFENNGWLTEQLLGKINAALQCVQSLCPQYLFLTTLATL